jgi:hypothetical protein
MRWQKLRENSGAIAVSVVALQCGVSTRRVDYRARRHEDERHAIVVAILASPNIASHGLVPMSSELQSRTAVMCMSLLRQAF